MKVVRLLMLFLVAGAVAQAQTVKTDKKEKVRTERKQMYSELNFTAEQKASLKDIHAKEKAEMTAIKNNANISTEQKKEQFKTVKQQYRTQRETVFTPDQKEKMKKMKKDHPHKKGMKHKGKMHEKKTV
jgi:uncharacterized protein HemX